MGKIYRGQAGKVIPVEVTMSQARQGNSYKNNFLFFKGEREKENMNLVFFFSFFFPNYR